VRFAHVNFSYEAKRQILFDVDFQIPAGTTTAETATPPPPNPPKEPEPEEKFPQLLPRPLPPLIMPSRNQKGMLCPIELPL